MPETKRIPLDNLIDDPANVRVEPDLEPEFIESLREQGIIQPLVVRPLGDGRYGVVVGKRRFHAAQRIDDIDEVKCEVRKDLKDDDAAAEALSLSENRERLDISPGREREVVMDLLDKTVGEFSSAKEAARKLKERADVPISKTTIAEYIKISDLPTHLVARLKEQSKRSEEEKSALKSAMEGEEEEKETVIDTKKQVPERILYGLSESEWFRSLAKEKPVKAQKVVGKAVKKGQDKVDELIESEKEKAKRKKTKVRKPTKKARGHPISFSLGDEEYELLEAYAEHKGIKNTGLAAQNIIIRFLDEEVRDNARILNSW